MAFFLFQFIVKISNDRLGHVVFLSPRNSIYNRLFIFCCFHFIYILSYDISQQFPTEIIISSMSMKDLLIRSNEILQMHDECDFSVVYQAEKRHPSYRKRIEEKKKKENS